MSEPLCGCKVARRPVDTGNPAYYEWEDYIEHCPRHSEENVRALFQLAQRLAEFTASMKLAYMGQILLRDQLVEESKAKGLLK